MKKVIDSYKDAIIQIATPYSTGTGFYLADYNLIVTNDHVIRGNREVVINGNRFEKQISKLLYADPKYDLAFLALPKTHEMPIVNLGSANRLTEGDPVVAVGHPFGLKFTATKGIVSNMQHQVGEIRYIQHDAALNPGNSGGPLVTLDAKIVGVNTFIIKDGNNIGFSLPVDYLIDTLNEFREGKGEEGARCYSCENLVFSSTIDKGYCPHCGTKMILPSEVEPYKPAGVNKQIEVLLESLGYKVTLSRIGPNQWEIEEGSATLNISYHEKTGLIVADAYLALLPKKFIKPLYKFLLKENYKNRGMTLSVRGTNIILSSLIFDRYFNIETAKPVFKDLFTKADYYDNILVEKFGAMWRSKS